MRLFIADAQHLRVAARLFAGRFDEAVGKVAATSAGVAGEEQTQALGDAVGRGFDAGQAGAVGTEADAFVLVFAETN